MISGIALNVLLWSTFITKIVNPDNLASNIDNIFPEVVAQNFQKFIYIFNVCNFFTGLIGCYLIRDVQEYLGYEPGTVSDEMISESKYSWEEDIGKSIRQSLHKKS